MENAKDGYITHGLDQVRDPIVAVSKHSNVPLRLARVLLTKLGKLA
ncbi:MAG TPA: hypothetical protein VML75_24765 [Kofleriaceae bacterium]|nr:hypothetical protein [Kofleriaceae bacterium]